MPYSGKAAAGWVGMGFNLTHLGGKVGSYGQSGGYSVSWALGSVGRALGH